MADTGSGSPTQPAKSETKAEPAAITAATTAAELSSSAQASSPAAAELSSSAQASSPAAAELSSSAQASSPVAAEPEAAPATVPAAAPPAALPIPADILPAAHWQQQELAVEEPDEDDGDSSFGDAASSTASLTASILEYRTINGRSFHSERGNAQYWGPNDEKQNESMDINHHLLTLVLDGKLLRAPIEEGTVQKVLDVGTGTGLWAIDFADANPQAEVIGTDISPIQPSWVPPNVKFEIEDATLMPWTFASDSFDFVHMRYLFGSIADWQALFEQAYRVTKPGGWCESFEMSSMARSDDGSVTDGSALAQWSKVFAEGGRRFGRSFTIVDDDIQRTEMEKAGFVDLDVWDFKCPLGSWPRDPKLKECGIYSRTALEADIEGYVLFMFNAVLNWTKEEIMVYIAHLRRQVRDSKNTHAWFRMRVVYGRKPE